MLPNKVWIFAPSRSQPKQWLTGYSRNSRLPQDSAETQALAVAAILQCKCQGGLGIRHLQDHT
uniref:Uncharacterized protein n=1 Tax=Oryza nivara TaxID=4536 RepID=A0A0E0HNL3_ORYNI